MAKKDLFKIRFLENISTVFYDERFKGFLFNASTREHKTKLKFRGREFIVKKKKGEKFVVYSTLVSIDESSNVSFVFKIPLSNVNEANIKDLNRGQCFFSPPNKNGEHWQFIDGWYDHDDGIGGILYVEKQRFLNWFIKKPLSFLSGFLYLYIIFFKFLK